MRRPTSWREQPESSNAKARLRRSSNRSALPFSLGIGVLLLNPYYCIIYADINNLAVTHGGTTPGPNQLDFPAGSVIYRPQGWLSHVRFSRQGDLLAFADHVPYGD